MVGDESKASWTKYSAVYKGAHSKQIDPQIDEFLEMVAGFTLSMLDSIEHTAQQNKVDFDYIKGIIPFFMDSAKVLVPVSREMSLITTSNQARHLFEVYLIFKFIFESGNVQTYADRYRQFAVINHIRAANKGLVAMLTEEELIPFRLKYPFWFHPNGAVKGKRGAHWTGEPGITNIEELADRVSLTPTYNDFYHIGSGVAHGSPEMWRMFLINGVINPVPESKHIYRFSLCSCAFLLEIVQILGDHFATGYTATELTHLKSEHSRLMATF